MKKIVTFQLEEELFYQLSQISLKEERSMSSLIRLILKNYLENNVQNMR